LLSGRDPSKFFHRQDQKISRLPTAATRSLRQIWAGSVIFIVRKIFIDQLDRAQQNSSRLSVSERKASSPSDEIACGR
jgi:hypothetical protein